ncbi:MAG TPA: HU family DNA-binding protein, partial [Planctomycetaceae bacterium]
MVKKAAGKPKPISKSETFATLAERTGLSKKDVAAVFDELNKLLEENLSKKGPRVFNIPGLMKVYVHQRKATPARTGRNPATGEEVQIPARPAKEVIKV